MGEQELTELERAALLALDTLLFIDDVMPTRKTARVIEVLAAALGDLATVVDVGSLITNPVPAQDQVQDAPPSLGWPLYRALELIATDDLVRWVRREGTAGEDEIQTLAATLERLIDHFQQVDPAALGVTPAASPMPPALVQVLGSIGDMPGLLRDLEAAINWLLQRGVLTSLQEREAASRLYSLAQRIENVSMVFGVLSPDLEGKIQDPLGAGRPARRPVYKDTGGGPDGQETQETEVQE